MKTNDLNAKSVEELRTMLGEEQQKLTTLKFQASFNQLKKVSDIDLSRRLIARILTVLKSKELNNK